MKIKRCSVVDEEGRIIIFGGTVRQLVSKDYDGQQMTHVIVNYYKTPEDAFTRQNIVSSIIPLSRVYFFNSIE